MAAEPEHELDSDEAKEALAGLKLRPGYSEAIRQTVPDATYRVIVVMAALVMGALAVMGWLYVTTPSVKWIVTIAFGGLAVFFLATLFVKSATTAALGGVPRAAVVVSRTKGAEGGGRLQLMLEHETIDVSADPALFDMVRAGDTGVATTSGVAPLLELHSFRRL